MQTIEDLFVNVKEVIEEFLGFEIELVQNSTNGDWKIDAKVPSRILRASVEYILSVSQNVLKDYAKTSISNWNSFSTGVVEEICQRILRVKGNESYRNEQSKFIQALKDISIMTYETDPVSLGIIYFPFYQSEQLINELGQMEMEYIPFKIPKQLRELVVNDKMTRKIINGKSLAFVVDENFLVIGLVRKTNKSIRDVVFDSLKEYNSEAHYIICKDFFNNVFASIAKQDRQREINKKLSKKYNIEINDVEMITSEISKIFSDVFEVDKEMIDELASKKPKYYYVEIKNRSVDWYRTEDSILSISNGKWRVKDFSLVKFFIFENLFVHNNSIFDLAYRDTKNQTSYIKETFDNIGLLISRIKSLSSQNIGALFLIFEEFDDSISYRSNIKVRSLKSYLKKFKSNLLVRQDPSKKTYINVIYNNNATYKLIECDSYLFELVSSVDGAVLLDSYFNILSYGELFNSKLAKRSDIQGSRTLAAIAGSNYGISIKVSEDGDIEVWYGEEKIFHL